MSCVRSNFWLVPYVRKTIFLVLWMPQHNNDIKLQLLHANIVLPHWILYGTLMRHIWHFATLQLWYLNRKCLLITLINNKILAALRFLKHIHYLLFKMSSWKIGLICDSIRSCRKCMYMKLMDLCWIDEFLIYSACLTATQSWLYK